MHMCMLCIMFYIIHLLMQMALFPGSSWEMNSFSIANKHSNLTNEENMECL